MFEFQLKLITLNMAESHVIIPNLFLIKHTSTLSTAIISLHSHKIPTIQQGKPYHIVQALLRPRETLRVKPC